MILRADAAAGARCTALQDWYSELGTIETSAVESLFENLGCYYTGWVGYHPGPWPFKMIDMVLKYMIENIKLSLPTSMGDIIMP